VLAAFITLLRMRSPRALSPFASSPDVTGGTTTHGQYCWSAWLLLLVRALRSRLARRERVCTPLLHVFTTCPRRRLRSSLAELADFFSRFRRSLLEGAGRSSRRRLSRERLSFNHPVCCCSGANFHSERGVVRHIPRLRVAETIVAKRTAAFERLVMSA